MTLEETELRDWSRVSLETDPCVGITRRAVLDLVDTVLMEANKLSKSGWCQTWEITDRHCTLWLQM